MKLLGKRVLARIIRTNPMRGSLYLPEQKDTCEAAVLEVGDEIDYLIPGDRIIFDRYGGIECNGTEHSTPGQPEPVLFAEKDILAKIESGDEEIDA